MLIVQETKRKTMRTFDESKKKEKEALKKESKDAKVKEKAPATPIEVESAAFSSGVDTSDGDIADARLPPADRPQTAALTSLRKRRTGTLPLPPLERGWRRVCRSAAISHSAGLQQRRARARALRVCRPWPSRQKPRRRRRLRQVGVLR